MQLMLNLIRPLRMKIRATLNYLKINTLIISSTEYPPRNGSKGRKILKVKQRNVIFRKSFN